MGNIYEKEINKRLLKWARSRKLLNAQQGAEQQKILEPEYSMANKRRNL